MLQLTCDEPEIFYQSQIFTPKHFRRLPKLETEAVTVTATEIERNTKLIFDSEDLKLITEGSISLTNAGGYSRQCF